MILSKWGYEPRVIKGDSMIKDEKDLGKAIKNDENTIEIEGDLARKVIKIKATGAVAWAVCFAALVITITFILAAPPSSGLTIPATLVVAPTAASILGGGTAVTAVGIAIGGGSAAILNKLREYRLEKISDNHVILHRK